MGAWKYQKKKSGYNHDIWIRLQSDVPKKLKIKEWQFLNNPDEVLFKCSVVEEDGEPVDKFWTVWNYDLKELLKKKLKPFKPERHSVELVITKKGPAEDDEDGVEEFFELEMLTKKS